MTPADALVSRTLEVERSVLGGILVDPERFDDAREHVQAADFYRDGHRVLFAALARLHDAQIGIDLVTLVQHLTAAELERAGGPAYVASLLDGVPRASNVRYYAQEVADKATRRAVATAARRLLTAAEEGDVSSAALLEEAERTLFAIRARSTRAVLASPAERALATYAQVDAITSAAGALRGLTTGLTALDADLRGLHPGNLITVGARPSMGKTALAHHFAMAAGASGVPALMFSLEMSLDELNLREVTTRAGVNSWRLTHGLTSAWEQRELGAAMTEMENGGVYVVDTPHVTVGQIGAISRRARAQCGLSLVVVDYLQLIPVERRQGDRAENRTLELGEMSRTLKRHARELEVPVVLLSQLSRQSEARPDKRPQLSDLRESGAIEQDSDVVLLLHRPNAYPDLRKKGTYTDHYTEVHIAKQRNGPTGIVPVAFYREQTRFADYTDEARERPRTAEQLPLDGVTS